MSKKIIYRPKKDDSITLFGSEETYLYYRLHPTIAARDLLGIRLSWFQRITLRKMMNVPNGLLVWGRGTGKSQMIAVAAILQGFFYPNYKIGVYGPIKRQGDYIFNYIEQLYHNSPFFKSAAPRGIRRGVDRSLVEFMNGSFIDTMAVGDGSKLRGARYNCLFMDEFAQFDEDIMNLVILPFLAIQKEDMSNKLIIASSAYYRWNHLWDRYKYYRIQESINPNLYFVSEYDFRDIILDKNSPFKVDMNIVKHEREIMTDAEFKMEWTRLFPEDEDSYFPRYLIDLCTPREPKSKPLSIEFDSYLVDKESGEKLKKKRATRYILGIDIGRAEGGSNFAISVGRIEENFYKLSRIITGNGISYQEMVKLIRQCVRDFNVVRIHMDKGGGGETLRDLLKEPWMDSQTGEEHPPILDMEDEETEDILGHRILKLINFHGFKHANLFTNLKAEMEHGRILFPTVFKRDEDKKLEMAYMEIRQLFSEMMVTKPKPVGNTLKFEVPYNFKNDRVVALALGVDAYLELRSPNWLKKEEEDLPIGFFVEV